LTDKEKRQVENFKAVQDAIHRGPLYTHPTKRDADAPAKTFSEDDFNKQYGGRGKADVDPFTAVETYSQKYDPPKRTIPDLKAVRLDKKMFPKELWSTLEGDAGEEVKQHIGRAMKKKAEMMGDAQSKTSEDRAKIILEKIKKATGEEDAEGDAEEGDEEGGAEEEEDYDYEEDEGEMGGDYDAEKYFDGGEEDEEEGDAGGDDY
jgi:DNA-directed RNA polymerase III subunit RPC7